MPPPLPPPVPRTPARRRGPRRPEAHFLTLDQITLLLETAWNLGASSRPDYLNALRTELCIMTGLRGGELHNLTPRDLNPDGTVNVRFFPSLKYAKPRLAILANGGPESPTLPALLEYAATRAPDGPLWPSGYAAWHHWVTHRLGPASGLQRRISTVTVPPDEARAPRYFIHPHALRSAFVVLCRRLPRRLDRDPVPWDTICALGGWESVDTVRRHYYYADHDEHARALRAAIPPTAQARPPTTFGHGGGWSPGHGQHRTHGRPTPPYARSPGSSR